MHLLRLIQSQVKLGEPLPWGVRDQQGKLLLARGQVIANEAQLAALLERGASVDIEEVRAAARGDADTARPVSLFAQWEQVLWQLDRVLRSVSGEPGFGQRVNELVQRIEALTLRDPDIAIYLTVRQDPKRLTIYALAHSVHCAMVSLLMARRLGWDEESTHTLMKAALTMNIAILDLQGRMAAQGVPPTPPQMDMIRVHPTQGVEMLKAAGIDELPWLEAIAHHHRAAGRHGLPGRPARSGRTGHGAALYRRVHGQDGAAGAACTTVCAARRPAALPGIRRRAGVGGDHQGVRHLPAGRVRAAQVGRDGGGGAPRRQCQHAAGRRHHRPARHAQCQYGRARHLEARIRHRRARGREEPGAARAAGAAVRLAGVTRIPDQALPWFATAAAALAAASASPR